MTERALIDTGPLVAIHSRDDAHHERCSQALTKLRPPLLTCWPVLTEAAWLLRKRPDAIRQIFQGFENGLLALATLDSDDLAATATVMRRYEDAGIQLAEREGIRTVFTTDRRDFSIIRLKRNRTLKLVPDAQ